MAWASSSTDASLHQAWGNAWGSKNKSSWNQDKDWSKSKQDDRAKTQQAPQRSSGYIPGNHKAIWCKYFQKMGSCRSADQCRFAHSNEEILQAMRARGRGGGYKTQPCKYHANGYCGQGDLCTFLHEGAAGETADQEILLRKEEEAQIAAIYNQQAQALEEYEQTMQNEIHRQMIMSAMAAQQQAELEQQQMAAAQFLAAQAMQVPGSSESSPNNMMEQLAKMMTMGVEGAGGAGAPTASAENIGQLLAGQALAGGEDFSKLLAMAVPPEAAAPAASVPSMPAMPSMGGDPAKEAQIAALLAAQAAEQEHLSKLIAHVQGGSSQPSAVAPTPEQPPSMPSGGNDQLSQLMAAKAREDQLGKLLAAAALQAGGEDQLGKLLAAQQAQKPTDASAGAGTSADSSSGMAGWMGQMGQEVQKQNQTPPPQQEPSSKTRSSDGEPPAKERKKRSGWDDDTPQTPVMTGPPPPMPGRQWDRPPTEAELAILREKAKPAEKVVGYKHKQCVFWVRGFCRNGTECTFAHGEEDVVLGKMKKELIPGAPLPIPQPPKIAGSFDQL